MRPAKTNARPSTPASETRERAEGPDTKTVAPNVMGLVLAAQAAGATVMQTPAGIIIVIPSKVDATGDALLSESEAAHRARTTIRVVRGARRRGDLVGFGGQRDRSYRLADVEAWIASRQAPIEQGADDADVERRMRRLRALPGGKR